MNGKHFLHQAAFSTGSIIAVQYLLFRHNNLDKVKTLLQEFPTLLYATWDWCGGDFETGLEGAGHVGNKDIVNHFDRYWRQN